MKLKHFALYTKGHYVMTDDMIADLRKCFDADGYCGEYMTKHDMVTVLTKNIAPLLRDAEHMVSQLLEGIDPRQCWKRGYYHSTDYREPAARLRDGDLHNQPYDMYIATIKFYMSEVRFKTVEELGGLPTASRSVLPLQCDDQIAKITALIDVCLPDVQILEDKLAEFTGDEWPDERVDTSVQLDDAKNKLQSLQSDLQHWIKVRERVDSTRTEGSEEVLDSTT
jgi:hypothetical protein